MKTVCLGFSSDVTQLFVQLFHVSMRGSLPRGGIPRPRLPAGRRGRSIFRRSFATYAAGALLTSGLLVGLTQLYATWRLARHENAGQRDAFQHSEKSGGDSAAGLSLVESRTCEYLKKPPWVCAHGGDTSHAPPNTVAAYRAALQAKVECVEVDASRTRDGHLVALHSRDLQNIRNQSQAFVGDFTLRQLRELDAGANFPAKFKNQKILTLEEALQMLTKEVVQVTVDIKIGPPLFKHQLADDVIAVIGRAGCDNCLIWAKEDSIIYDVNALSPKRKLGYVVMNDSTTNKVTELLRIEQAEVIAVYWGLATRLVVERAHSAKKEVHVWTVNEESQMGKMLENGVDAIVTNEPQKLQKIIANQIEICKKAGHTMNI